MENNFVLDAELLKMAYSQGIFPMAEENQQIAWYCPDPRAVIPIQAYKAAKSLRPIINRGEFDIKINQNFKEVMQHCARPRSEHDGVWISPALITAYTELHQVGFAHSVEAYQNGQLVGGLYGVHLGAGFFGESMFSLVSNASKVAFHYLIQILRANHFELLDTQFINDNVLRYGAIEIPREVYLGQLKKALKKKCIFELPENL